jgi:hypothetical protein
MLIKPRPKFLSLKTEFDISTFWPFLKEEKISAKRYHFLAEDREIMHFLDKYGNKMEVRFVFCA